MMNKLAYEQCEKVYEFMDVTGQRDEVGIKFLRNNEWHVERAVDAFYSEPQNSEPDTYSQQAEELYNKYKDSSADAVLVDGISLLCNDLQVDPQDIVMFYSFICKAKNSEGMNEGNCIFEMLVLSWHMRAVTMCEYTKEEFISGLKDLGVSSIETFRNKVQFMRDELKDDERFCAIYDYAFDWAKEKGQKSMALDTAIEMWQLVFKEKEWPLIEPWCQFVQVRHNKAISKDTWSQLLAFSRNVDPSLSNYDSEGAWPYLIDEFVDYLLENGIVKKA